MYATCGSRLIARMPAAVAKPAALSIRGSPPTATPNCDRRATPRCASSSFTFGGNGAASGRSSTIIGCACAGEAAIWLCRTGSTLLRVTALGVAVAVEVGEAVDVEVGAPVDVDVGLAVDAGVFTGTTVADGVGVRACARTTALGLHAGMIK